MIHGDDVPILVPAIFSLFFFAAAIFAYKLSKDPKLFRFKLAFLAMAIGFALMSIASGLAIVLINLFTGLIAVAGVLFTFAGVILGIVKQLSNANGSDNEFGSKSGEKPGRESKGN